MPLFTQSHWKLQFLFLTLAAATVFAQDAPIVNKGTTEIGGFVGASYGTQAFQVMGGGNVSYAITKRIMPYAEFSYFPGLEVTHTIAGIGDTNKGTGHYNLPLADVHFGIHYRFPVREKPFVPYAVLGLGTIHNFQSNYTYNYTILGQSASTVFPLAPGNSFAVNFGGGVRYYTRQKVGFRVEAKVYRSTGIIDGYFSKFEFGVFYQIH